MINRQVARRAMMTFAAVAFAASLSLFTPSSASADGSGGVPPPPPTPPTCIMPYINAILAIQAAL